MLLQTQPVSPLLVPSIAIHRIKHCTWIETYFTFLGLPAEDDYPYQGEAARFEGDGIIADIHQFGDREAILTARGEILPDPLQGPETSLLLKAGSPGGVHVRTLSGVDSTALMDDGRVIGHIFEDCDAKYCILGDMRPDNPTATPVEQSLNVLRTIQEVLASVEMDFRDVVRTWFYNDQILEWYAEFNEARSAFFQQQSIELIPASTGIGVSNTTGVALVVKAIAVLPKNRSLTIRRVESPLQSEASTYGSAFSRAMEVTDRTSRVLYISGTASIEANGKTAHAGNPAKQIEKTMEVVEAILARNKMSLSDTVRAIGYFRHRYHIPLWDKYCQSQQLPPIPIILTECDICRDDLLFEIELDASTPI